MSVHFMLSFGNQDPQWLQLWTNASRNWSSQGSARCRYHPLPNHMLDVAAVTGLVWGYCLGSAHSGAGGDIIKCVRCQT